MKSKPGEEQYPWHQDVQEALATVRKLIEDVVRREQHRNDLTGLPNERALDQEIDQALEGDEVFWCAFVEIDHFKRLNDVYKYQAGNAMLEIVAESLRFSAATFFSGHANAFHAHGDEFYLLGREAIGAESVHRGLEMARQNIGAINQKVAGFVEPMTATVTIGWAFPGDLEAEDRTRRGLRRSIEDAVAFGKRKGRNRTLKYSTEMKTGDLFSERGNCIKCEAAFTMDVEKSKLHVEPFLWCPNCGAQHLRAQRPSGEPSPSDA